MTKVLITGGTGFVNSFLASSLLEMGEEVIFLSRSSATCTAAQRIQQALRLTGLTDFTDLHYRVIESDLVEKKAGISPEDLARLKLENIDEIIHGAGSVNFSENHASSTFNANFYGTKKMLELADLLKVKCFHYIGTAYAAENNSVFDHILGRQIPNSPPFNNTYEYSKNLAASLVRKWGEEQHTKTMIYEPSIIAGHSISGKAFNFSAFYNCLNIYRFLQGKVVAANAPHIKVQIPGHQEAKINLITIDYFTEVFKHLRKAACAGTYKIINECPPLYGELQEMCLRYYGLDNSIVISNSPKAKVEINGHFDPSFSSYLTRRMSAYLPYISRSFDFDNSDIKRVLNSKDKSHFKIIQQHINAFAAYADQNNFKLTA